MIAQQLLGLVQQLAFMLCAGSFITPSQLPQNLYPRRLTHCFILSGHGNPTSGAPYPFTALCTPSRVTKLLAQFDGSPDGRNCSPGIAIICILQAESRCEPLCKHVPFPCHAFLVGYAVPSSPCHWCSIRRSATLRTIPRRSCSGFPPPTPRIDRKSTRL